MKTRTSLRRLLPASFILLGCWLLAAVALRAQPGATGTIQGRVFNPTSQEYVRNAEVRLVGSNQVTYTENDGAFTLAGVPVGTATVTITYTGYNTVNETVQVSAGQVAVREINLVSTRPAPRPPAAARSSSCRPSPSPPSARATPRPSWTSAAT